MKLSAVYGFLFLTISLCYSQSKEVNYPDYLDMGIGRILNNSSDWNIIKEAKGYLNGDKVLDFVLVLQLNDPKYAIRDCEDCTQGNNSPRMILILVNNKVVVQNNKFIARGDEGGMIPYIEPDVSMDNGKLNICWQYTRSHTSYTFEYKKKDLMLTEAETSSVQSTTGKFEHNRYLFLRGEIISETGHISDEHFKKDVLKIKLQRLKKLSELGEMYDWEVVPNFFL